MVYLQSYFDESGTIEKTPLLSFCGWIGTNSNWEVCCEKWDRELRLLGIETFKANQLFHYNKPLSKKCPATGLRQRVDALSPLAKSPNP